MLSNFDAMLSSNAYSPERIYIHPYYIATSEKGLLRAKIKHLKCHTIALDFCRQTDM